MKLKISEIQKKDVLRVTAQLFGTGCMVRVVEKRRSTLPGQDTVYVEFLDGPDAGWCASYFPSQLERCA